MPLNSSNWRAELDLRAGKTPTLHVTGDVSTPGVATLRQAPVQGTFVQNLHLLLEIEDTQDQTQSPKRAAATFSRFANQGQFTQVTIFYDRTVHQRLNIIEVH